MNNSNLPKAIFLMGPTACGKTKIAISIYQQFPVELINVDSALIYRGMDIGTAKPTVEELKIAPHRLLDICDPSETYSAAKFRHDAIKEMQNITKKGKIPLLVGGTMLYFKVLLKGLSPLPPANPKVRQWIEEKLIKKASYKTLYPQLCKIDPISANRIHPNDFQRILRALEIFFISGKTLTELIKTPGNPLSYDVYQFAITPVDREILYKNIALRYKQMLALGFEAETRILFKRGDLNENMPSIRCVGYRQMWSYLRGKINYNEMIEQGIFATRQLAKRQMTWLRCWPHLYYLDSNNPDLALNSIINTINKIKR